MIGPCLAPHLHASWLRSLALLSLLLKAQGRQCLPNAIPEEQRLNITMEGVSMPVGLSVGAWESAIATSDIFEILTREVLGYHTVRVSASGGWASIHHLAGCTENQEVEDATLCPWPPRAHIALEIWPNRWYERAIQDLLQKLGPRAAKSLGEIGYLGYDGLFVLGKAKRSSLEATGLHLSYYGNYNASWFDPASHGATLADVDLQKLKRCDESLWVEYANSGTQYFHATGDAEGVEEVNGRPQLKCYQDKWWLAPSCRSNPARCMAVITGGNGWGLNYISQQAFFHSMPLALATAASYNDYLQINQQQQSALYWWLPDPSFAIYEPSTVELPPQNPSEYRQAIYRTMSARSKLLTIVSADLQDVADRVYGLADNLHLSDSNVADLLLPVGAGMSSWDSACEWLKANPDYWSDTWVPDKTVCSQGRGIVDLQSRFVNSREDAVDCAICPAGRASVKMQVTRVCSLCARGSYQSTFGTTECELCEPGTLASAEGSSQCEQCGLGTYAHEPGRTSCERCGVQEDMWTTSQEIGSRVIEVLGATSETFCTCKAGSFLWQGACQSCIEGSSCQTNRIELIPGYFSFSESPGSVYRCKDGHCPGGPPGTCAPGRDPSTLACTKCQRGLRSSGEGHCEPCGSGEYVILAVASLGIICGIVFLHVGLMGEIEASQTGALVVVSSSLIQLVTILQMLSVIGHFAIDWQEPLTSLLHLLEMLSLDLDMLSIGCVTDMGPVALFSFRVLLIPLVMLIAVIVHLGYLAVIRSRTFQAVHLLRTCGTIFLMFFIMLFSMLLAPFQCSWHPNGLATLKDYGMVYCNGQGEHLQMFIIGGIACLVPAAFVAVCTWIVTSEIPRRLARSDAMFLRTFSFLIRRFRPGTEIFSILFLMRNALLVLILIVNVTSGQLMLFSSILCLNLFLVAFAKPWRVMVCNFLDGALSVGMLLILNIGCLSANELSSAASSMMVVMFLVVMAIAILVSISVGSARYLQQKYRKQFRFFLCHHKVASGSMARLLKMKLDQCLPGTKTFIDCDDLSDLTRLFAYVAEDTETFLILGSPAILTRKWCIGEMNTARSNGVKTFLLAWPNFVAPDEAFILNYANMVPDIRELTKYGVSLSNVEETFRWLSGVGRIELPGLITSESISNTIMAFTDAGSPARTSFAWKLGSFEELSTDYPILADPLNTESMAAAMVLADLLKPRLLGGMEVPSVLTVGKDLPTSAKVSFIICSLNCFQSEHLQSWLLQGARLPMLRMIPVIAEEGFVIPNVNISEARKAFSLKQEDLELYLLAIKAIFQEIALVFLPQSYSHLDLELRANQAAMRLTSTPRPLSEKVMQLAKSASFLSTPAQVKVEVEDGEELRSDDGSCVEHVF